jgi:hypothetical protein
MHTMNLVNQGARWTAAHVNQNNKQENWTVCASQRYGCALAITVEAAAAAVSPLQIWIALLVIARSHKSELFDLQIQQRKTKSST